MTTNINLMDIGDYKPEIILCSHPFNCGLKRLIVKINLKTNKIRYYGIVISNDNKEESDQIKFIETELSKAISLYNQL